MNRSDSCNAEAVRDERSPHHSETGVPAGSAPEALYKRMLAFPAVLMVGLIVVTVFTIANRFNDPDLWWHLKVGETIWNTRSIPSADAYSFTVHGHPWMDHEWLAQWMHLRGL